MKKVYSDVTALYVAHGARYLFILLTLPYLARVLGLESFGVLLFFQSVGFVICQAIEYGFAYNGTRIISQAENDSDHIAKFLSNVLFAQALVFVFCLLVTTSFYVYQGEFNYTALLVFTLLSSFFQAISLNWFFRGLGKTVLVAKLEILAKTLSIALMFLFVKTSADLAIVMLVFLVGNLTSFCVSILLVCREFNIQIPTFNSAIKIIVSGWNAFLVRAGGSIIGDGNVILASAILEPVTFGIFAGAYRVIGAIRGLFVPLIDAMFPYFTRDAKKQDIGIMVKKFAPYLVAVGSGMSVFIFLFAESIVRLLLGDDFHESVTLLRVFAVLPLIISLVHGFGTQWLVALGRENIYSKIVLLAGFLGLVINYLATPRFESLGVIFAILFSYSLIALVIFTLFINRKRLAL